MDLFISDIQRFCMHDGPGVRTTVFMKGCPLRCVWCHNPEMQEAKKQLLFSDKLCLGCGKCAEACPNQCHSLTEGKHLIDRTNCVACGRCVEACVVNALELSGKTKTTDEILEAVLKDVPFYGSKGGLTVSGGEPTAQMDGLLELLRKAKEKGIHTCIETCGMFPENRIPELAPLVDVFYYDVKLTDEEMHRHYTGVSNKTILSNLSKIDSMLKDDQTIRLRCILIETVNNTKEHLEALCKIYHSLNHCEGIEFLPYHTYGDSKNGRLGRELTANNEWIPSNVAVQNANAYLKEKQVPVFSRI